MKALLIGNITIDQNRTERGNFTGPGGAVYFAARTFNNLSINSTIISSRGTDLIIKTLPNNQFYPSQPDVNRNLVFHNIYDNDRRTQRVENYVKKKIFYKLLKSYPVNNSYWDMVMVLPVLDNIDSTELELIRNKFKSDLYVLSPQGLFRKVTKSGQINKNSWKWSKKVLQNYQLLTLSEKDTPSSDQFARIWSRTGPITLVTRAERGCSIYVRGKREDIAAFHIDRPDDTTGAGDIFTATLSAAYRKSRDIRKSAVFACATAAFCLRFLPNQLQYSYSDIIQFIKDKRKEFFNEYNN